MYQFQKSGKKIFLKSTHARFQLFNYKIQYQSIYQNHYYFRPNDKSPIQCFKNWGVTVMQKELETQL